ncbi:hypothetical protein CBOM_07698 [Ceraceosorus bombacis]|uniref:Uncharacterized protein n=1 Tax=Ceraceosorus bombacis TaxID=401625 RepID=A0A0P1BHT8_9BASI|nr:hypothetical protein CBOM_07698 [Ceraceosorus bombacis]
MSTRGCLAARLMPCDRREALLYFKSLRDYGRVQAITFSRTLNFKTPSGRRLRDWMVPLKASIQGGI